MAVLENLGLRYQVRGEVYDPSDDTWLLASSLRVRPGERFLEVGTGAGIVALAAARTGAIVTATDVSPAALGLAAENAALNGLDVSWVRADLLRGIRSDAFDWIAFNPPYLPTDQADRVPGPINAAFDGGPDGRRITERFLTELSRRPPCGGTLVLVSSLQGEHEMRASFERSGLVARPVARKKLSHETLTVFELTTERKSRTIR